jgi:alkanesulfonate monooxygenase SsuD/methylene tetrahydromethanopterin reductase-like flavin-dependent oxidoreductase (luciferase family)
MRRGFAVFAGIAPQVIRAAGRTAEALGYDSFWVNHPGRTDGLAALAAAAAETRRIALGIGVVPLHSRGPDSIAEGVRAHALPVPRLLLGVGSAGPGALGRVRDGAAALRARVPGVRLIVAALGPRMCRLAGEVADGVLFNWLTPEHARRSGAWVADGAAAAGREPPALLAYVRLAVGGAAQEALRAEGARYAAIPAYAAHFRRMRADPLATAIAARSPEAIAPAVAAWEGAVDELVFRAITAGDGEEETLDLVRLAKP